MHKAIVLTLIFWGCLTPVHAEVAGLQRATQVGPSPLRITSGITAVWWNDVESKGDQAETVEAVSLAARASLWSYKDEQQELLTGINASALDIDTRQSLPSGERIDDTWYTLRGDVNYRRWWDSGHVFAIRAEFGSHSNEVFGASDSLVVRGLALVRQPDPAADQALNDADGWLFGLQFDNARNGFARNLPVLPLIAYQWQRKDWDLLVGVPFIALEWRPSETWDIAAVGGVTNQLEVQYKPLMALRLYLRLDQTNQQFLRADRRDNDQVVTFSEWRIGAGVRTGSPPTSVGRFTVDLFAGLAFEREIAEFSDDDERDENRIEVDNGAVIQTRIGWLF